jgi:hypothetical protein
MIGFCAEPASTAIDIDKAPLAHYLIARPKLDWLNHTICDEGDWVWMKSLLTSFPKFTRNFCACSSKKRSAFPESEFEIDIPALSREILRGERLRASA